MSGNRARERPLTLLERMKESSHPVESTVYVFFRLSPLALYLFGMLFTSNFVLIFILVALLLAADFWNVKNIAGRLMVGLRWWNETAENGESVWVFETADPQRYINPIDSQCFWVLLYGSPALWVALGFLAVLKFQFLWLLLIVLALVLTLTNTFAFSRSDKFARANDIIGNVQSSLLSRAIFSVAGRFFG